MNKIPTVFERDWEGERSRVFNRVAVGCEWVVEGEGVATRKYDGTCVMFDGEDWWARREVKAGKQEPRGFRPVEHDHVTLAAIGWQPIADSPFAKFHAEALTNCNLLEAEFSEGTYELCGPKVQGNPEGFPGHVLVSHADVPAEDVGESFEQQRVALAELGYEGFVWKHPDGRMAKIKGRDFGLKRITDKGREALG